MSDEITRNSNNVRLPLSRLRVVAARYVLGSANSTALVQAADAILDSGIYSWSVGELATFPSPSLREVGRIFEKSLEELGIALPSLGEAVRTLILWHLYGVIEGRESPDRVLCSLWEELHDRLTFDRRIEKFEAEKDLLYFRSDYDDLLKLAGRDLYSHERARLELEWDTQFLKHSRSWICQEGSKLLNSCWLSWNGGIVRKLAQAIVDERAWDRLPILADALEEAGCNSVELLEHCRAGESHTVCCWVTDILLQKAVAKPC